MLPCSSQHSSFATQVSCTVATIAASTQRGWRRLFEAQLGRAWWERRLHVQRHLTTFGRENFFKKVLQSLALHAVPVKTMLFHFHHFFIEVVKQSPDFMSHEFSYFSSSFFSKFQWIVPSLSITYFCHRHPPCDFRKITSGECQHWLCRSSGPASLVFNGFWDGMYRLDKKLGLIYIYIYLFI